MQRDDTAPACQTHGMDIHFLKLDALGNASAAVSRTNSAAATRREWGSRISIPSSDSAGETNDGAAGFAMNGIKYEGGLRLKRRDTAKSS